MTRINAGQLMLLHLHHPQHACLQLDLPDPSSPEEHCSDAEVLQCVLHTGVPDKEVEPYRMYNLDVFEYLAESNFGLYGSVPLLLALKPGLTVGAFWCAFTCIGILGARLLWKVTSRMDVRSTNTVPPRTACCGCCRLNAAEMYVDISKPATGAATQWIAESGVVDLFLLTGPRPSDVSAQYASVTGGSAMPQMFALGCAASDRVGCLYKYNRVSLLPDNRLMAECRDYVVNTCR